MMDNSKLIYELQNNRVNKLGLDLDRMSKYDLLLTYFKAKKAFPNAKVEAEVSSSGKGFHIIVHEEMSILENILWRARLGDDGKRVMFSLAKFAHDPELSFFDLMFTEKYGKPVKPLNIDELLKPHEEIVTKIKENWGTEEALVFIQELAPKLQLPIERYWTTAIKITEKNKDDVVKAMRDIAVIDESFKWRIFPNFLGHGYILIVYSPDMDQAHKRGVWLINKIEPLKGYKYWVRRI